MIFDLLQAIKKVFVVKCYVLSGNEKIDKILLFKTITV